MRNNIILFFMLFIFISCNTKKNKKPISISNNMKLYKRVTPLKENTKNWEFKDILLDTIAGISLQRAYDSILLNKKESKVIVAVIDMTVETNHTGLDKYIWNNKNEIPNNEIDDDNNGYIDDISGWNFLGNLKNENNLFVNYEYTRFLRKYNSKFKGKTIEEISTKDTLNFILYKKAENKYQQRLKYANKEVAYIDMVQNSKNKAEKLISTYLKFDYNLSDLDSLKNVYPKNKELQKRILIKSNFITYGYSDKFVTDYRLKAEERINKLLNLEYNDRTIQGDDANNIEDSNYGSNKFNTNTELLDHGTKMAGIISKVGLKDEIMIMPLTISAYGDEHDKDIALAIRYAVNNGAKVINLSFAKEFSLHPEWVLDAIKFAEEKNVLIVSAASNENENLDDREIYWFPNDHNYFSYIEVADNFLNVGSSGIYVNEKLKSSFSNYGKDEVDVFAPGESIYTTYPNNQFDISYGGTSSAAALTSGTAALVYSYFPSLSAGQVKHILMDSGIEYSIEVDTPTHDDKNKTTPFNKLSKSGKIINVYNALIMAESISKNN